MGKAVGRTAVVFCWILLGAFGLAWASIAVASACAGELTIRNMRRVPAGARTVTQEARDVPVVAEADVAVVGGGVAGVAAALAAAAEGAAVVIIEERNHFGYEFAATLRPAASTIRPGPDFKVAQRVMALMAPEKLPAGIDQTSLLKGRLAELVKRNEGIRSFLYSWANAALMEGRTVRGAVMVNPSGRQAVLAKTVVDATWDGRIAAAAGAPFDRSVSGDKTAHRYLLITHPAYTGGPEIAVPKTLGLLSDVVRVHDGGRVLEISARVRIGEAVGLDLAAAECATRRLAMEAVGHLREHVQGFDQIDAIREQYPRVTLYTGNEVVFDEWPVVSCDPPLTPRGVQGLLVAGLLASGTPESFDLVALLKSGETAGRLAARMAKQATLAAPTGQPVEIREEETSGEHVREFLKGPDTGRTYPTIHEGTTELSIVDEVDVLVIGGGTAGAPAAIAAAQMGVRVAVLEILPFLGGTAVTTIHSYYDGVPHDSKLRAEIDAYSGASREKDRKGPWSIERRKLILQKLLLDKGGRIYCRAYAAGAVVEGHRVAGVVVEGAFGRGVILARLTVDATGHGDVAAAAGAPFAKGRQGDGAMHAMALTPSMANDDSGVRDPTNVADATDITLKRMALTSDGNTFSPHITPRESRHILGDHVLTLGDLVAGRTFPDAVMLCLANYDRHDLGSYADESDAAQNWIAILGCWFEVLGCQVPYRSLLPRGLDNILVVGKAFSGDHDAHIVLRMQRDLMHMGEASGVAAAMAARSGTIAGNVPVKDLQDELIRRGVLRAEDLPGAEPQPDPAAAVRKLGGGSGAQAAMIDCYRAGAKAIPALMTALNSTDPQARAEVAVLLGMQGERAAAAALLEILAAGERMNRESRPITWKSARIAPQLFTGAVILLGRFGEKQAVPGLRKLIDHREKCPPDVAAYAIQALEKIGDPSAVASIQPYLQPYQSQGKPWRETDTDETYAVQAAAARALAKLGDLSGLPVLIDFLADDRALVRDYAHRLLEGLTGQRFGKDRQRWRQWLENERR